jgi:tetratricopeptide (TPR) repeat protein
MHVFLSGLEGFLFLAALPVVLITPAYLFYRWARRREQESLAPNYIIFVAYCTEFDRLAVGRRRRAFALRGWGKSLSLRAARKSGPGADVVYAREDDRCSAALALTPDDLLLASKLILLLYYRGERNGGEAGRQCLIRACDLAERIAERDPNLRLSALFFWGAALRMLGGGAGHPEAAGLYALAAEKYSTALGLAPDDDNLAFNKASAVLQQALEHPGEAGYSFLAQARDGFERLVVRNPRDTRALAAWTASLLLQGARSPDVTADSLYSEVEQKCSSGLEASPTDEGLLTALSSALYHRADVRSGEDANEVLARASVLVETTLRIHPRYYHLLPVWSSVLSLRAQRMPGEETNRLLKEGARQFEEAAKAGLDPGMILGGWATVLFAQARVTEGPESTKLFEAAREKYLDAESRAPGSAAYNLACVATRLGELDECKSWIVKSREPGILISRDRMARDPDLAGVRQCDWFRELVAK